MAARSVKAAPDPAAGPGSDEMFEFQTPHGLIRLPSLAEMPIGIMRKARKSSGVNQLFDIIEALADPDALEIFDKLNAAQVAELNDEWARHSGVSVGESKAS